MSDLRRYFGDKWAAENGEERLLRTHELYTSSVVFDVGGYTGEWAREISDRYDPQLYIFEPIPQFCETLRQRFRHNPKAKILEYGLASDDGSICFRVNGSATEQSQEGQLFKVRAAADAILELLGADTQIDLMAINIEGGEYDLIPHLMDSGVINRIRSLVIQFHMPWPSCYDQWKTIRGRLNVTHGEKWGFPMVWEFWDRR